MITASALSNLSKTIDRFTTPDETLTHSVVGAPATVAVPDVFTFRPVRNVALSTQVFVRLTKISGLNVAAPISISGADGEFSVRCRGVYTKQAATIFPDEPLCIRITSSAMSGATVSTVITIGGVSATLSVLTDALPVDDTVPEAFSFASVLGASPGAISVSQAIVVSGINKPTSISINGVGSTAAMYSVGCNGAFNAAPATVSNGDTVCLRLAASDFEGGSAVATLSIGGVDGIFLVRNYSPMLVSRYRIYMPLNPGHLLTTDENEYNFLTKNYPQEFIGEGVDHKIYRGRVSVANQVSVPNYRLYLRPAARHFWTTDANEYEILKADTANVLDEGVDGYLYLFAGVDGTVPLYRMVLAGTAIHHWTTDANEFRVLTSSNVWLAEGAQGNPVGVSGYVWQK